MTLPSRVHITEVGPRDGLQNEQQPVPVDIKVQLCERLLAAGVGNLETTSFVSPKWVPQMSDAAEVLARIPRPKGVIVSVLTPNMKGLEGALAAGVDATEAFSNRNINCSIAESMERFRPVAEGAKARGVRVRGAVSVAFGCPYQGDVPVEDVVDVVKRLADLGCDEIGIADTIGTGTAAHVRRVMEAAARAYPIERISGHFHDTYGQAIANIYASLQSGIHRFDTSIAGLGGCPYAKGATGNVATEDVVFLLNGLGIDTGLDLDTLVDAGQWISTFLGRKSMSRTGNALAAKKAAAAQAAQAAT